MKPTHKSSGYQAYCTQWNPPTKVVGTKHIAHNVQATAVKRRHWPDNPEHEGSIRSTRSKQWLVHRVPRKGCNQQDHVSPALLGQKQSHITCTAKANPVTYHLHYQAKPVPYFLHCYGKISPIIPALLWQNQSHNTCTAMAKQDWSHITRFTEGKEKEILHWLNDISCIICI